MSTEPMYESRQQAGDALIERLRPHLKPAQRPMVLGIPMGGILVGAVLAEALSVPLGLIQVDPVIRAANRGPTKSLGLYISDMPHVYERMVIVVDDGLHDDLEVHRTLVALKRRGTSTLIIAAPVLRTATAEMHGSVADVVICLDHVEHVEPDSLYARSAAPPVAQVRALLLGESVAETAEIPADDAEEAAAPQSEPPMLYQNMLVPMDFGDAALRALREARRIQAIGGGRITLLYITDADANPQPGMKRLAALRAGEPEDAKITMLTRQGEPAEQIVDEVQQGEYDLVVMGTHGRAGLHRAMFGSVAERVIRQSLAPVMVIR